MLLVVVVEKLFVLNHGFRFFFSNVFINFFPRNRTICVEKEKVSQCANLTTSFHDLINLQLFNKPIRMMTWEKQV